MKNFLKNLTIPSYLSLASVVLIVVSLILSIVSSNYVGYGIPELGWVIAFSILAILLILSSLYLGEKYENHLLSYLPMLVAVILLGLCFLFVLKNRTYLIGTLWVTKLDQSNPNAVGAMNAGAPSFILYFVGMILLSIASFFDIKKKSSKKTSEEAESI